MSKKDFYLYIGGKPVKVSEALKLTQVAIHKRKKKALERLRELLK